MWFRRFLLWLSSKLVTKYLGSDGDYLHRSFIYRGKKYRIYLHRFLRSDDDSELHNHPWPGLSLILSGSYIEERLVHGEFGKKSIVTKVASPGMINKIGANDFHRVDLISDEVWTLFIVGEKKQDWGFIDRNTFVYTPHEKFFAGKPNNGDTVDID